MKLSDEEIITLKQTYLSQVKGKFLLGDYLDFMLKIQDEKSICDLIKWLDEPCTEHGKERTQKTCAVETYDGKVHDPIIKKYMDYPEHRKDCSLCWRELTGEKNE